MLSHTLFSLDSSGYIDKSLGLTRLDLMSSLAKTTGITAYEEAVKITALVVI